MSQVSHSFTDIPNWQQKIRDRCVHPSGSVTPFSRSEVEQSIPRRFQKQVEQHGDRVAVQIESGQLTYEELNTAANRIAHALLAFPKVGPGLVLHLFEQGIPAIAAMLGILKSGRTYVPLDPLSPTIRLSLIAGESQSGLIVTNTRSLPLARKFAGDRRILNVDELESSPSIQNPERKIAPDELAWVIYTSGSTGRPKGVMQTHRNVLHFMMNYTDYFRICPEDRLSDLFSFSTHAGSFGLLLPLLDGATLLPLDLRQMGPDFLTEWLPRFEVTVCCMVPTVFRRFASELPRGARSPDLRLLYLAGEPVLRTDFELYRKHMPPGCIFVNRFGSTEMDCTRLFFADKETRISSSVVPIGYGVRDKELLILDEQGGPAGVDQVGEITIKSRYLSPGYWQRPDLTKAAFTEDDEGRTYRTGDLGRMNAQGCVEHMGRKDFQVKIRGHRVEIAEVEEALLELAEVKDAAVTAREDRGGAVRLVAYVVSQREQPPTTSTLRNALTKKLPDYMIPGVFMMLAELPYAPNQKVDRRSLPEPGTERPELASPFVAARSPVERKVASIWAETLGITQVGVHDPFLELGGNSLLATQIRSMIKAAFAVTLSSKELFESLTVALMARAIERRTGRNEIYEE